MLVDQLGKGVLFSTAAALSRGWSRSDAVFVGELCKSILWCVVRE